MKSCEELRADGRKILGNALFQGRWLFPLLACLIVTGIGSFAATYFLIPAIIIDGALSFGYAMYFLNLARCPDGEEKNFKTLFSGFVKNFGRNFGIGLYMYLISLCYIGAIYLCTVLTYVIIVPIIFVPVLFVFYYIFVCRYAVVYFVAVDNPEYGVWQVLRETAILMKGYKWKYFKLQLSFIGWNLVSVFTLGIASYWITPYINATNVAFYEQLKELKASYVE